MRRALPASAALVALAACHTATPPRSRPAAAELQIEKMPAAATAAPLVVAPPAREPWRGSCGDHSVGNPAPPVASAVGEPGDVTLVYFWATWCAPCERDFDRFQELFAKDQARGFDVLAISVDDDNVEVARWARARGATFAVGWDAGHKDAGCWRIGAMPSAFVVDRAGIVRFVHEGYSEGDSEKIAEEIESLL